MRQVNDPVTVLSGGVQIDVIHTDGKQETVLVRKIPIRELHTLGLRWGKEGGEIDLYCAKDQGWSDTLSDDSWEKVIETGRALNCGPFERWYNRQQEALKVAGVNVQSVIDHAAQTAVSTVLQKPTSS